MRKVCVVITARPSYSRIKTALKSIKLHKDLELQLVLTTSALLERYGNVSKQIETDGFIPNAKIYNVVEGDELASSVKTTGLALLDLPTIFAAIKPDVIVTIADRFETISTAITAAYMNIPLVHIQGGEVTGSIDEKVRHAVTKLSDYHFVSNEKAAERVIRMGESPESVFVTGCPSIDLAAETLKNPVLDYDPIEKYGGVGEKKFFEKDYIIVMQHPVTDEYENARLEIRETLNAVNTLNIPTYWMWPNIDAGSDRVSNEIRSFRERIKPHNVWFFKDIPSYDFLKLLYNSKCIVGNSSVAIRECAFLGVPAVNIGSRQSGRERGRNVIDVGYNRDEIIAAVKKCFNGFERKNDNVYGCGDAGRKIADLLSDIELKTVKKLSY